MDDLEGELNWQLVLLVLLHLARCLFGYESLSRRGLIETVYRHQICNSQKMLQGQRVQVQKELAKLDKAIAVLRELSGTNLPPSPNGKRHTMSVVARRKIGKAQKARWAKLRQKRANKG
jgi:hypothetical protein